jgi:FAD binding domain-containing protein
LLKAPDLTTTCGGPTENESVMTTQFTESSDSAVFHAEFDELRARMPGKVLTPGDAAWEQHRHPWVVNVDQHPRAVVLADSAADVVAVVQFARRHGMTVAAQPGGHGATRAVDDTILLRTRGITGISIDTELRVARVGAGVKWGELLTALEGTGLTGLAGSTPDTTVVGLSVGGGMSWFGRAYGLAADSIEALDVVDADGELVRVTAESDPDLFWAIRGGGGDFGIITAIEIRLHPAEQVYGGRLLWPIEQAPAVLHAFREVTTNAPDELTVWFHLLRFPPVEDIPEPLRGGSFVTFDLTFLGGAEEAERLLAPVRALPSPMLDTMAPVKVSELGDILQEPLEPLPAMERSRLLPELPDAALDALLAVAGPESDTMLMIVQLRHLGGALARPADQPGAVGTLSEAYQLFLLGIPAVPELVAPLRAQLDVAEQAMAPFASGRRTFNFLGSGQDPSAAFTPQALERLRAIKLERDPAGVIRSNRPVLTGSTPTRVPGQRG